MQCPTDNMTCVCPDPKGPQMCVRQWLESARKYPYLSIDCPFVSLPLVCALNWFAWFTLKPRRWWKLVPPKHLFTFDRLRSIIIYVVGHSVRCGLAMQCEMKTKSSPDGLDCRRICFGIVGFDVRMAVTLNTAVVWIVMPCSLLKAQCFRATWPPSSVLKSGPSKKPAEAGSI
jgi:hypothetical protein